MTRKEYEAEIAALKKRIAELETAQIEEEPPAPPHPRWKPEQGYYYYCVEPNPSSPISFYYYGGELTAVLENEFDIGNLFRTIEDAGFAAERLKVLAEMREWAGKWCDTWCIYYTDGRIEPLSVRTFKDITYGEMRFATNEDAQNCIKAVGEDRIKKYYFIIPETK